MRANPGGTLAAEDVVGRDGLIDRLWRVLEAQSIVLTSERRIGKTSVIRKMADAGPEGTVCLLRDVEGFRSPGEFIEGVHRDVQPMLSQGRRALTMFNELLEKMGGTQIGDLKLPQFKQHWKSMLDVLFEDIFKDETRKIVFFWDELPLFLHNVIETTGERGAMELLDALRSLRQRYANLRMVFTGSVGMHQIIARLRRKGYANDPTNDMATIEVPPLDPKDGAKLAALLLKGEGILINGDPRDVSRAITDAAGHIPYYCHYLVARIRDDGGSVSAARAEECFEELIADPNDPAHFGYYKTRLRTYYEPGEAQVALHTLDTLASREDPCSFQELLNLVRHKTEVAVNEDLFRQVLNVLQKDHYVMKQKDGTYTFRYLVVRRWWAREGE